MSGTLNKSLSVFLLIAIACFLYSLAYRKKCMSYTCSSHILKYIQNLCYTSSNYHILSINHRQIPFLICNKDFSFSLSLSQDPWDS
jgi:hypothetical protein